MPVTQRETDQLIKLTIGMFNAAPGATYLGLLTNLYEANGHDIEVVADILAESNAFRQLHSNGETAAQFAAVVLAPFGLQANATALQFIVGRVNAGVGRGAAIAQAMAMLDTVDPVVGGPIGAASAILDNRAEVANFYSVTFAIAQTDIASLQNVVVNVDASHESVVSAENSLVGCDCVATVFTLYQDTLLGGSQSDAFSAGAATMSPGGTLQNTLQDFDSLNGAGGIDTLAVSLQGGVTVTPTLESIELINLRAIDDVTLVLARATGVTGVTVAGSTGAATVTAIGSVANLAVTNQNQGATFGGSYASALNLTFDTVGASQSMADQQVVTIANTHAATLRLVAHSANVNLAGLPAVASIGVAAVGANRINLSAMASSLTSLAVVGFGSIDFSDARLAAVTALTVGDGSITFTGGAPGFTATTGSAADTLSVAGANVARIAMGGGADTVIVNLSSLAAASTLDLGDGNDTVAFAPGFTISAGATLAGGAGFDTLVMDRAAYDVLSGFSSADIARITGFERVVITGVSGNTVVDLAGTLPA